jgi:pectate lyase
VQLLNRSKALWGLAPYLLIAGLVAGIPAACAQPIPAFPGAEGAGAFASGGRPKVILGMLQGEVYHVTTLAADPAGTIPGSLRYGMRDENFQVPAWEGYPIFPDIPASYDIKPRIIVFDVGGTIVLNNTSPNSDIDMTPRNFTIAGQTAPGGITIYGAEFNPGHREAWDSDGSPTTTNNLIIRNLTVRTHNANEKDAFWVPLSNSIVDHISGSWYTDEGVSITDGARNITVQHSIVGPGWNSPDGDGSQIEGKTPAADISVHHNLYIHNDARIPRVGEKEGPGVELDFRNNVIFNFNDSKAGYSVAAEPSFTNFVNNYYIGGPGNSSGDNIFSSGGTLTRIYQSGNFLDLDKDGVADGSDPGWSRFAGTETQVATPYPVPHGVTQTAAEALATVQGYVGARWWSRDFLDQRAIQQLATFGLGTTAQTGQVLSSVPAADVTAVVNAPLQTRPAGYDSDNDGMPDEWEAMHSLNPNSPPGSPDWGLDYDNDGYINVEEFINELAEWPAPYDIVFTGGTNARYEQITNWSITGSSPGESATTTHWQPSRFDVAAINSGSVTVDSVGQHAGTIRIGSGPSDNAILSISGGWLKVEDEAVGPGNGEVIIGANPTATAALNLSGGKLTAKTLSKGAGGSFNFTGGVLSAQTVDFDLVNNGGTIAPGNSPGLTHVTGDLTLNAGVLEIEIGGTGIGQFDRVEVDGVTTLGGTLKVELIDLGGGEYVPQSGDQWGFLAAYGGGGGTFDTLDLPALSPGLEWAILPGDATYFLSVVPIAPVLAGDYNDDGVVDAADYVVWRQHLASNIPLTNETASPGVVDQDDFDAWRANFGATAGSGSGAAELVPEPAAIWLLVLGLLGLETRFLRGYNRVEK